MKKKVIWSNYNLDYEDWKDFFDDEYPDLDEDKRINLMYELNNEYLDDERMNLDIPVSEEIIVLGDLGLWDGRKSGYKEIHGHSIKDCLYTDTDYATWYLDGRGDLCCEAIHHDGTNHYLYRVFKPDVSDTRKENFLEKVLRGTVTRADITRTTQRLGDKIAEVYGWKI